MAKEIRETEIRKVVWQKAGNPWGIFLTTDRQNESWKGPVGENVTPGTWVKAEGHVGPKEGRYPAPFIVDTVIQIQSPKDDVAGAWMQWRLPEIGEVRAERLSEQFSRSLPDLFDSGQIKDTLATMSGLTPKRVSAIMEAYREYPDELRVAMWLGEPNPEEQPELGMRWVPIKTVIEEYNKRAGVQQLRADAESDPYELMAIDGITFRSADDLGEALGFEERDPRRLRGMVWEKLEDLAGGEGICVLPRAELFAKMRNFGWSPEQLQQMFSESPHFQLNRFGAQLFRIARAEAQIASKVQEVLSEQQQELPMSLNLPDWLDPSQKDAVEKLQTTPIAILTGGPGTGKTTVLKTALDQMEKNGARVLLASPTGKAAKRMTETTGREAKTVHKLLEWTPEGFRRDASNPLDGEVVVVDEASMLDVELASSLFEALGGARLLLVGDVDQLPPVGPGQPLLDLMRSENVPTFRLTKTHRQKADSWVIDNAPKILKGQTPSLQDQGDFQFLRADESDQIIRYAVAMYQQAKEQGPAALKQLQVLTPEHKRGAGTQTLNFEIQKAMNPKASDSRFADDFVQGSGEAKIYVGDKVFYTKNNAELGLVNGNMGVVEEIEVTADSRLARVRFEGDINPRTGDDLFELRDADIRPLQLAYAMTVHKAQGSEWSNVVVVADKAHFSMRRKLLYTAITRTNNRLTIIGSEEAVARGARNNPDENRATLLQQRLRGEL